jgi:hypothetical protein
MRASFAASFALVATLPWFYIEAGYIYISGFEASIPFPSKMRDLLETMYRGVVEGPLFCYAPKYDQDLDLHFALFYPGEGVLTARPLAVSIFWLVPAIACVASIAMTAAHSQRTARQSLKVAGAAVIDKSNS